MKKHTSNAQATTMAKLVVKRYFVDQLTQYSRYYFYDDGSLRMTTDEKETPDFLYDLYPDLPWDTEGLIKSLTYLTINAKAIPAFKAFYEKTGFDAFSEFKSTLKAMQS